MRRLLTRSPAAIGASTGALAVVALTALALFETHGSATGGSHPGVGQVSPPVPESPRAAGRLSAPPLVPFPYRLAPGICILGGLEPAAAYVIETTTGLVLVDAGLRSDASLIKSQLEHLGLDWKQIRAILITHAHGDHSGGAERLRTETRARVYAGRGDAEVLRAGGPREAIFSAFSLPGGQLHTTTIDVELTGNESIEFGDTRIKAMATPGHTPGSVCYLMEREGVRTLFTGDVISSLVGDQTSLIRGRWPLGTYSAYMSPRFRGDARAYLTSLRALRAIDCPRPCPAGSPSFRPDPTGALPDAGAMGSAA